MMSYLGFIKKSAVIAFFYVFCSLQAAFAEDIEIFLPTDAGDNIKPNILFIFDTSGSMNSTEDVDGDKQTRIGILQDVMTDVLSSVTGVNMGLARFSVPGGPILYPVVNPDAPADPIIYRSVTGSSNDAYQSQNSVDISSDYLEPTTSRIGDLIALRFENVAIPQGATIESAELIFSSDVNSTDAAKYTIRAESNSSPSEFAASVKNISNRTTTTAEVTWVPDPWIFDGGENPNSFESVDISPVVQEVINLKGTDINDPLGWCGGNNLVIILQKETEGFRKALSYDGNSTFSPKLRIDFSETFGAGANKCYSNEFSVKVSQNKHDADTYNGDNKWYLSLHNYADSALGFENVAVPKGANIIDANLTFYAASTKSGNSKVDISGVDSSAPPFGKDIFSLPSSKFTSSIEWAIPNTSFGLAYQSVGIGPIVKSIINRTDWDSGDDMSFLLERTAGTRYFYARDGSSSRAPELNIKYRGVYAPGATTKREALIAAVEDFKATGNTPISDTLAEAALYFRGENVKYGLQRGSPTKRDNRISHIDSFTGGVIDRPTSCTEANLSATSCKDEKINGNPIYTSPITEGCQANHIVLLTDGAPTSHNTATGDLYKGWSSGATCSSQNSGKDCAIKIAGFLSSEDNDQSAVLSGNQTVTTHTIGFYESSTFLQDVADAGGGTYTTAYSKDQLFDVITETIAAISDVNTTFVSAGVTVNQYNRLTHSDQMYFSLFSPDSKKIWPGNIKRYRLLGGDIVDANDAAAVNPLTSEFADSAQSFWSSNVDGKEVTQGGHASKLTNTNKVYSNINSNTLVLATNQLIDSNASVTTAMIGVSDAAERTKALNWISGQDVHDTVDPTVARQDFADPLHSQPTLVAYQKTLTTADTSIFVGSNDGLLHSIDSATGQLNWAFMPADLLDRIGTLYKEEKGDKIYGIDGSATIHIEDSSSGLAGAIDSGESAYLYIGMRRGGRAYYALDISDRLNPKLMFKIDNTTTGYSDLGETWSKPVIARMNIGGKTDRLVMIFGGGYDATTQDVNAQSSQTDSVGNNVYIADALTGALVWSAKANAIQAATPAGSLATMNSVPAEVSILENDESGLVEHLYVADTKAQVFRFDVDNDTQKITGGRIAHLNDDGSKENNRRFYYSTDVSFIKLVGDSFNAVAIGSGYRAHPLDESVNDLFFVLRDKGALNGNFDMDLGIDDLVDITSLVGNDTDGNSIAATAMENKGNYGWYLDFSLSGEKVLERSVTFNNAVIFTTYIPASGQTTACSAAAGGSRAYALKIIDGNPYVDTNYDGDIDADDRYVELVGAGIAPAPQILVEGTDDGIEYHLCFGTECGVGDGAGGGGPGCDGFICEPPPLSGLRWKNL